MILVGLTGGIGAGKSTVARLLAAQGAAVVDADAIVRDLQRPGESVFQRIVERFGAGVLASDGSLDRAALAAIVFADDAARTDLNGIVHPAVRDEIARRIAAAAAEGADVVVLDVPLIAESYGREGMSLVVTVEASDDVRVERLVRERGMDPAEARARIAAQATRQQREAIADVVMDNDGDLPALEAAARDLWRRIESYVD